MTVLRRLATTGALLGLAMQLGVVASSAHPATGSAGKIPVVACKTSSPLGRQPTRYPKAMTLKASPAARRKLAFYTDRYRSVTPVLGPRGWACAVSLGEDGSGEINIHPNGRGVASPIAVDAFTDGACQGCVYATVCKLIPGSGKKLGYAGTQPCDERLPKHETDTFLVRSKTYDVVHFVDPARVKGTGDPSGGKRAAHGVLLYAYSHRDGGAASIDTCSLSAAKRSLCATILGRFRADKWRIP
jgi:hypothetical protein